MKKKLLGLVACAATLALSGALLAGCAGSGSNDKAADNNAASTDKTTLTVGFDQSYPPYGFVGDDGKYTGFDLDLAKAVCDKNGWSFEATPIDWDAKDALLSQGNINCIWNGFTMEGREDGYTFSDPYMLNEQVVVVKAGSDISDFAGLSGKTVMTQVDSAALDVLEGDQAEVAATFKGGAAQTIGDYNNAFMQLDSGMNDAVACDLSIAQYQISANPGKYVQLETPLSTEHYAVGFKKGNTELANQVTETLKQLDADGTVKKLCEKYAEYGLSYTNWILK
ncbi:transporter substrate-binding domain-containing protein [uncultured Senegalimassilia sp.]|uniref:transporter substrate-binding domain-containing protein n=1 Tax=uncultured Senegalimassilia sp. TaxID=1714350 RepID=UPI0025903565|nr:transporter substrate-binding domain-containing protein [uncultured Senegalimassilia sp.]